MRSEVSVPLRAGDSVIGVLNIESGQDAPPLDEGDLDTMVVVGGPRVGRARARSRARGLRERAALFARLAAFGSAVNASLDLATAHASIVGPVAEALQTDIVSLILRDLGTGDDRIVAIHGGDERYVGVRIPPGEGMSRPSHPGAPGRVVRVGPAELLPDDRPGARVSDVLVGAAIPLLDEEHVVGAISREPARPGPLVHGPRDRGDAAHRIAGRRWRSPTSSCTRALPMPPVRDPLTGLWNRRHLEVSTARLFAARARLPLG